MKKTIEQFEREKNIMIRDVSGLDLGKQVTEEQFVGLANIDTATGIDIEGRTQWLKDNGHAVTRKNLLDHSLESIGIDNG